MWWLQKRLVDEKEVDAPRNSSLPRWKVQALIWEAREKVDLHSSLEPLGQTLVSICMRQMSGVDESLSKSWLVIRKTWKETKMI